MSAKKLKLYFIFIKNIFHAEDEVTYDFRFELVKYSNYYLSKLRHELLIRDIKEIILAELRDTRTRL